MSTKKNDSKDKEAEELFKALVNPDDLIEEILPENPTLFDVYGAGCWHPILRRIRVNIIPTNDEIREALRSGETVPAEMQVWLADNLDVKVKRPPGRKPLPKDRVARRYKMREVCVLFAREHANVLAERSSGAPGIGTPSEEAYERVAEIYVGRVGEKELTADAVRNIVSEGRARRRRGR